MYFPELIRKIVEVLMDARTQLAIKTIFDLELEFKSIVHLSLRIHSTSDFGSGHTSLR